MQSNKDVLVRALKSLFEDYRGAESEFVGLFSPDFHLWANGVTRDLNGLIAHFDELEKTAPVRTIDFIKVVAEADTVFTQHVVTVALTEDTSKVVDVFARWTLINGQITDCQELTRQREA